MTSSAVNWRTTLPGEPNTLIAEGKDIPPRSMVMGSPGKVVRQLTDDEVKRFSGAAGRYVENWKRFAAGLKSQS